MIQKVVRWVWKVEMFVHTGYTVIMIDAVYIWTYCCIIIYNILYMDLIIIYNSLTGRCNNSIKLKGVIVLCLWSLWHFVFLVFCSLPLFPSHLSCINLISPDQISLFPHSCSTVGCLFCHVSLMSSVCISVNSCWFLYFVVLSCFVRSISLVLLVCWVYLL